MQDEGGWGIPKSSSAQIDLLHLQDKSLRLSGRFLAKPDLDQPRHCLDLNSASSLLNCSKSRRCPGRQSMLWWTREITPSPDTCAVRTRVTQKGQGRAAAGAAQGGGRQGGPAGQRGWGCPQGPGRGSAHAALTPLPARLRRLQAHLLRHALLMKCSPAGSRAGGPAAPASGLAAARAGRLVCLQSAAKMCQERLSRALRVAMGTECRFPNCFFIC